jgi:hypothetical protein
LAVSQNRPFRSLKGAEVSTNGDLSAQINFPALSIAALETLEED